MITFSRKLFPTLQKSTGNIGKTYPASPEGSIVFEELVSVHVLNDRLLKAVKEKRPLYEISFPVE
ncbi:MAG: hypothetical protein KGI33_07355 [Thaumarchaeota archaeon]|nr:hypothetical protein [Nitrososphaerota archaeon]